MLKGHPKGLIASALANMGERFGFYTMMAILALFLQAKFGLDGKNTGYIYATFYALIYILSLVGGIIADKTRNFKGCPIKEIHSQTSNEMSLYICCLAAHYAFSMGK